MEFKNVQRRVYDAINVLMALGIVSKGRQGMVIFHEQIDLASAPKEKTDVNQALNY